jgi:hypothetical protein
MATFFWLLFYQDAFDFLYTWSFIFPVSKIFSVCFTKLLQRLILFLAGVDYFGKPFNSTVLNILPSSFTKTKSTPYSNNVAMSSGESVQQ